MWYTNPLEADTNRDGLGDGQEWNVGKTTAPSDTGAPSGAGKPYDTDGDGEPDLFDRDNDGDGVPDSLDLSPISQLRV